MVYGNWKPVKSKKKNRIKTKRSSSDYVKMADDIFSLYLRELHDWTCQRCGRKHERGSGELGSSHYISRTDKRFRWDLNNCDPLCWVPCHADWESKKNTPTEAQAKKLLSELDERVS